MPDIVKNEGNFLRVSLYSRRAIFSARGWYIFRPRCSTQRTGAKHHDRLQRHRIDFWHIILHYPLAISIPSSAVKHHDDQLCSCVLWMHLRSKWSQALQRLYLSRTMRKFLLKTSSSRGRRLVTLGTAGAISCQVKCGPWCIWTLWLWTFGIQASGTMYHGSSDPWEVAWKQFSYNNKKTCNNSS